MVKTFALIFGIVYTAVGVMGFFPALLTQPYLPLDLAIDAGEGRLLGIFPVNIVHTLVHLGVGIWALVAARNFISAVVFARANAIIFGLLAVFGLLPGFNTLFGLVPLYGSDIWLHAGTALVAAYFGWGAPARVKTTVST